MGAFQAPYKGKTNEPEDAVPVCHDSGIRPDFQWNKDTFQPGDEVTLVGNPDRRPGHHSLWTSLVIFADGTEVDVRDTPE